MTSKQRVVVIGGGLAGLRLAARLGGDAEVTVLGEEPHAPYNRVLLAEVLAGRYAPEVIALPTPGPVLRRGVRAVRVDRADRTVHCDDGAALGYDTLVLATGSNPVLPPLRGLFEPEGRELPHGVHAFRTMDDCLALSATVRPGVRAVVIGGGLLGVSAARALAARGAQVVLAQQSERLMERQLDASASAMLHTHLTELGIEIHTECRVRGLTTTSTAPHPAAQGGGPRKVTGVELADGYRLDAEVVVLACGVRPRTGLAQAAGLEVRKGIVVDGHLRTGDPRIHAIGDCAEHAGQVYGLAGAALEQADALAATLTGPPTEYTGTRALTRLTLGGTGDPFDLAAFGETTPRPGDDVVRLADATRRTYRTVVVRGDRLVGGVLLGELSTVGALARGWADDEDLNSLFHLLTDDGGH
ncbi:NAD(P)/FAD-dependent oxidoreductase [Streptomyces sp. ISL-94]|uniref:NAD(P)/FAD-dependent oxidoreductase n=1 Tax=Streptomyces sp. ISL-94 TaxID=2819190 RepID=UPI001BEB8E76|nr:FAD-dependent oxidoreductase [Streptomyces sp. ISL-94]MBT2478259.1 NAD(P)/FAD-dependent oxidoreductase [Streptomyces sp. ISL-94]